MTTTPLEEVLPKDKRDAVRARCLSRGRFYNPWVHLGVTSIFGLSAIAAASTQLGALTWHHLVFGAVLFVAANAAEWRIHKSLLHVRSPLAPMLYDRHTPEHHVIFVTGDMEIRSTREFKLVLIPAYGIVLAFAGLSPLIAAFWFGWPFALGEPASQHAYAGVFTIVTMAYLVSYEWLHLVWHLPEDSALGRLGLVRALKRHHALHHDPRLMQRWNFNVTLPLWDVVRRTYYRQ